MNRNFDKCCKCDALTTVDNAAGCPHFPCPLLDIAEKYKDSSMHGAQFYKDVKRHRKNLLRFIYWGKKLWHSHWKWVICTTIAIVAIIARAVEAYFVPPYDIVILLIFVPP